MSNRERFLALASIPALALLGSGAFVKSTREAILKKDHETCRICGNPNCPTIHHIVPDSLENGREDHRQPNNPYDPYVRYFQELYAQILSQISPDKLDDFKQAIRGRINSESNGIVLCPGCHRSLHQNYGAGDTPNFFPPDSGYDLSPESLKRFMEDIIINPALNDLEKGLV